MSWTIEAARARLGLADGDTSQDAALTAAMSVALAAAEAYCDRAFMLMNDAAEEFAGPLGPVLTVRRWPLVALVSLQQLPPLPDPAPEPLPIPEGWRFNAQRGIVYLGAPPWRLAPVGSEPAPSGPIVGSANGFVLTYSGGYAPDKLPADLEAALWLVFDHAWATTPGWGLAAGDTASAPVRSFGIDGMSIAYEGAAAGGAGKGGAPAAWGLLPASAVGVLSFYRADSAALGA